MRIRTLLLASALTTLALGCDGSVDTGDDQIVSSAQFSVTGTAVL